MFALCFVPCFSCPVQLDVQVTNSPLRETFLGVICFSSHACSFFASSQHTQRIEGAVLIIIKQNLTYRSLKNKQYRSPGDEGL